MPKNTISVQEKGKRAAMQTAKRIFVNLPVSDLSSSVDFFTELGFAFDDQFTGDHASCMIIGDNMFAMLLKEEYFQKFIPGKEIADSTHSAEVVVALSVDCRDDVDRTIAKAVRRRRQRMQRRHRCRLDVWPRLPGPRRPRLGNLLRRCQPHGKSHERQQRVDPVSSYCAQGRACITTYVLHHTCFTTYLHHDTTCKQEKRDGCRPGCLQHPSRQQSKGGPPPSSEIQHQLSRRQE